MFMFLFSCTNKETRSANDQMSIANNETHTYIEKIFCSSEDSIMISKYKSYSDSLSSEGIDLYKIDSIFVFTINNKVLRINLKKEIFNLDNYKYNNPGPFHVGKIIAKERPGRIYVNAEIDFPSYEIGGVSGVCSRENNEFVLGRFVFDFKTKRMLSNHVIDIQGCMSFNRIECDKSVELCSQTRIDRTFAYSTSCGPTITDSSYSIMIRSFFPYSDSPICIINDLNSDLDSMLVYNCN